MDRLWVLLLAAVALSAVARADSVISTSTVQVAAGAPLQVDLTITNPASEPLVLELPAPVHVRIETATAVSILEFAPERSGAVQVAGGGFARIALRGALPSGAQGPVTLTLTGIDANPLVLHVAAARRPADAVAPATGDDKAAAVAQKEDESKLVDKPPPLALSVYEPVYFLIGGDEGLNAKFQISFRYRLFDGQGALARRLPWLDDLYLSFSQTSLWDLQDLSKPFKDSSYRPRIFFADYDLARVADGRVRLGVELGAGHESNGKDGEESRSFNMIYARPTLTVGDPDGLRFYVAPLIHNYVADDENPDLKDYRGHIDWLIGFGSKGGLDFWGTLRKGERSDYGSIELNASYPLSKLSGGDLTGWLMLQYFGGYGESLLDYNRKLDAQLRLGIAVAL
jgi:phospholipase A1/A2